MLFALRSSIKKQRLNHIWPKIFVSCLHLIEHVNLFRSVFSRHFYCSLLISFVLHRLSGHILFVFFCILAIYLWKIICSCWNFDSGYSLVLPIIWTINKVIFLIVIGIILFFYYLDTFCFVCVFDYISRSKV